VRVGPGGDAIESHLTAENNSFGTLEPEAGECEIKTLLPACLVARWRAGDQPNAVSDCRSRGDEQRMQWGVYRGRAQEQSTRWGISGQFLEKPEARREASGNGASPA